MTRGRGPQNDRNRDVVWRAGAVASHKKARSCGRAGAVAPRRAKAVPRRRGGRMLSAPTPASERPSPHPKRLSCHPERPSCHPERLSRHPERSEGSVSPVPVHSKAGATVVAPAFSRLPAVQLVTEAISLWTSSRVKERNRIAAPSRRASLSRSMYLILELPQAPSAKPEA